MGRRCGGEELGGQGPLGGEGRSFCRNEPTATYTGIGIYGSPEGLRLRLERILERLSTASLGEVRGLLKRHWVS